MYEKQCGMHTLYDCFVNECDAYVLFAGLATGFYCRYYPPVKSGPDNTPKSGFYRILLAFTIFHLLSSTKTVLSILYVY